MNADFADQDRDLIESHFAFEFVRSLARELSRGKVDLPSFPEVAMRVRRVLADPDSSIDQVIRVVGSEPALAARLLRISNSASFNRSGRPVTDLRAAVSRIGYNMVRSAAIAFAMSQIRKANRFAHLDRPLDELWQHSVSVAAFSYVLARKYTRVNPDEALLTGMMHAIGKLYLVTRAADHRALFPSQAALDEIIGDWHPSIGKAILENWDFPDVMSEALGEQNDRERDAAEDGSADLTDVLAAAILMASYPTDIAGLELELQTLSATPRLGLDRRGTPVVIQDSAAEVSALREALGA